MKQEIVRMSLKKMGGGPSFNFIATIRDQTLMIDLSHIQRDWALGINTQ